jgi:hypothetical protein
VPNVLPDLEAVPDDPKEMYYIKQCFRALQDRLAAVEGKAAAEEQGASLQAALDKLDARVGVLERAPAPAATVIPPVVAVAGRWRKTAGTVAGPGSYDWDAENLNTGEFVRQVSNTQIKVTVAGRFLVCGSTLLTTGGAGRNTSLNQSGTNRDVCYTPDDPVGLFTQAHFAVVLDMAVNDYVEVTFAAGQTGYGSATQTHLSMFRIGD